MLNLFKKREKFILPVSGNCIPMEKVNDTVFSQKMMGDGFAIIPSDKTIYSPFSGEVSVLFPTKHAIGIKSDAGVEVLIHVGIDTVSLKGEGFESFVQQGDKITQGDKLIDVDFDLIKQKGFDPVVVIIFTNNSIKIDEKLQHGEHHEKLSISIK
ncbi:MAG: PTS glucose transporter subunit IIA [Anaerorhabdus sp.]|uniref:PTS sugar transporter subunit IIA n=1 Tax=Anaerorhabdus sp. TaxID=1872524 RepID=UPI003A88ACA3